MTRKGKVAEIFSRAVYHDNPELYFVGFLDFDTIREVTLTEFLRLSENFEAIPATRIIHIRKGDEILFSKSERKDPTT